MTDLLRVYYDPDEINQTWGHPYEGYPFAWYEPQQLESPDGSAAITLLPVKDLIREGADNRCERCGHPYVKGMGEWSPCDDQCTHGGPSRVWNHDSETWEHMVLDARAWRGYPNALTIEAQWRILTTHHLNGVKADLRWWNLAALCQRCHLSVQTRVVMERPWPFPHSEWMRLHAAGFYAWKYLDEEIGPGEALNRLDELLALEQTHSPLF